MIPFLRRLLHGDAVQDLDDEIRDTVVHLHALLQEAEAIGGQFKPGARAARTMLRSIGWR